MLYVFGCSFSVAHSAINSTIGKGGKYAEFLPIEKTWTDLVSENLIGKTHHENYGLPGCGNDYIFYEFMNALPKFKSGDYVIVQLSTFFREWIFEDRPEMGNFLSAKYDVPQHVSQSESDALSMYTTNLYSEHRLKVIYMAIIQSIYSMAGPLQAKNVKMLILPGFHAIDGVNGNLFEVSSREIGDQKAVDKFYNKNDGDIRYNHLSEINHKILADKIIDFFTNFNNVDLTVGFKENIIKTNTIPK